MITYRGTLTNAEKIVKRENKEKAVLRLYLEGIKGIFDPFLLSSFVKRSLRNLEEKLKTETKKRDYFSTKGSLDTLHYFHNGPVA
jgi:hypothetical protein